MEGGKGNQGHHLRLPSATGLRRGCRPTTISLLIAFILCALYLGKAPVEASHMQDPGAYQSQDPFYHAPSSGLGLYMNPPAPTQQGPVFLLEPPPRLAFSNTSGAEISCSAHGAPPPDLSWILADGSRAEAVPGLRQPLSNGTLYFPPFRAEDYRDDVHSAVYRCRAANLGGVILSREVRVRAVIRQDYEVQVYRTHVLLGNAAVLRCVIPPFVRDYVTVTAWLRDDALILPGASDGGPPSVPGDSSPSSPSSGGNRFVVTSGSGDLVIRGARPEDGAPRYSCVTRHMLTGERKTSLPAILTVTEPSGSMPPRLTGRLLTTVTVESGSDVHLNCAAQGNPPPTFTWEKVSDGGISHMSGGGGGTSLGGRPRIVGPSDSPLLFLRRVSPQDAGRWECRAANAFGEQHMGVIVTAPSPLSVHVQPQLLVVNSGESATFNCSVSGTPLDTVRWLANGVPLSGSSHGGMGSEGGGGVLSPRIRLLSPQVLHISSVGRSDRGMYQCVARNEKESAQGSAELRLGEMSPELQGTFIEQTLRPGPGVSLRCSAAGSPPPRFVWALDGQPLTPHNAGHRFAIGQYMDSSGDVVSHVNISLVRAEDGGLYSCTATNSLGEAKHAARLNVYGPPRVRTIPPITAVAGSDLLLQCPYSGFPVGAVRWERRARRKRQLPAVSSQGSLLRHRTFPGNGSLLLTKVEAGADGGSYVCTVTGRGPREDVVARGEVIVRVKSPPVIEPFSFPEHTREGSRLQISCSVSSGDLPLRFLWLKDNNPLVLPLGASSLPSYHSGFPQPTSQSSSSQQPYYTTTQGDFFSLLVVPRVSAAHSGRYTCIASNDVASANHSATLLVNVAPQWVMEPRDVATLAGGWVSVHCQAKGFPDPTIVWMRGSGRTQSDYQRVTVRQSDSLPIGSNPNHWSRIYLPPNGTLAISNAAEHDEGYYLCKASNGIGSGLTKVIYIAVNEPVKFEMPSKNITARKGDAVTLVCDVRGDHPIHILWLMNGRRLNLNNYRFSLSDAKSDTGVISRVLIGGSERQDSGSYVCQADNAYGHAEQTLNLAIQEPPDAPSEVEVLEVSSRSVRLAWKIPFSGHSPLLAFVVQHRPTSQSTPFSALATSQNQQGEWVSTNFSANVQGGVLSGVLRPATAFQLRILALNNIGLSPPSEILSIKTQEEAPMGPPQEVQLEALGPEELQVSWKPPPRELWNGNILGYTVSWRLQNDDQIKAPRAGLKDSNDDGSKSGTDAGSRDGSQVGDGKVFSDDDDGNTKSRTIRWEAGASGEGDPNSLRLRIGGLRRFSRYAVTVRAFNRVGAGPHSAPVTAHTREGVPEASPETVSCVALSSQSLMVRWAPPPPHTHGGLLRGYKVIYTPIGPADSSEGNENDEDDREAFAPSTKEGRSGVGSSLSNLGSGTETKRITGTETHLHGLKKFTNYSLRLLAYTAVGDGIPSSPLICSTEEDVPGPPAHIKAVALSSDSVLVSWLPPILPNGRLLQYTVYSREAGRRPSKHSSYQVRAGASLPASSSSSKTGGGGSWGWGRELTYEVRGLTEHTSYEFWTTASTVVGEGLPTPLVPQTPTSRAPACIASFSRIVRRPVGSSVWLPCLAVGNPSPTTRWLMGGSEVPVASGNEVAEGQGFRAVPRRSGVGGGSGGELFAPKLEKRWEGNYSCQATNLFGQDEVTYSVVALTPPERPSDLSLQFSTDSALHLRWKAPDDGGSPIKGYVLSYKREHGSWTEVALEAGTLNTNMISSSSHHHIHHHLQQQQPGLVQYNLQGLRCGSPYQVYVTARNRVGSGPPSDILNAATQGGVSKVPSQNDLLSVNSSSVSLHLYTWPNGGCPFLYFAVQHRPLLQPGDRENSVDRRMKVDEDEGWIVLSNNVPPETERLALRGLSPATWYELKVTAHNDAGSTVGLFRFATTTRSGATIAPPIFMAEAGGEGESTSYGIGESSDPSFYKDVYVMAPITIAAILGLGTTFLVGCLIARKRRLCLNFGSGSADSTDGSSKQGSSMAKEGGSGDSSSCCKIVGAGSSIGLSGPPSETGVARHRGSRDGELSSHHSQVQRQLYTSSPVAGGVGLRGGGGMGKGEEPDDIVPRCDKLKDDQGDLRSELYEISPYATFSVPVSNSGATPGCGSGVGVNASTNRGGTMDYTMQFRTFGHSECGMGQMPKGKKRYNNANYGNKQRFTETRDPFGKAEAVCGGNGGQPLFKQHSRKESMSEDDRDDGVGMEHRQNIPPHHLNVKQLPQGGGYRVPVKRGGSDSYYRPDSSTESNEASPQDCSRRRGWRRGLDRSKEEMRMRSRSLGEAEEEDDDGEDDEDEEGLQDASVMLHPTLPAGSLGDGGVGGWALMNHSHMYNQGSYEKPNGHHWQKQGMMGVSREPSEAECDRLAVDEDNNGVDGERNESLGSLSNGNSLDDIDDGNLGKLTASIVNDGELEAQLSLLLARFQEQKDQERLQYTIHV
ncbi:cell adhesion molecule Dscam1 [Hetaerina americana]|uniref:cell adhesion molecule Dscam1 n=1 Tax=Hetaerina americana TaxID=62018 RepID=UPI003A7F55DD